MPIPTSPTEAALEHQLGQYLEHPGHTQLHRVLRSKAAAGAAVAGAALRFEAHVTDVENQLSAMADALGSSLAQFGRFALQAVETNTSALQATRDAIVEEQRLTRQELSFNRESIRQMLDTHHQGMNNLFASLERFGSSAVRAVEANTAAVEEAREAVITEQKLIRDELSAHRDLFRQTLDLRHQIERLQLQVSALEGPSPSTPPGSDPVAGGRGRKR